MKDVNDQEDIYILQVVVFVCTFWLTRRSMWKFSVPKKAQMKSAFVFMPVCWMRMNWKKVKFYTYGQFKFRKDFVFNRMLFRNINELDTH